jgi:4'-phosphopantetheinyl transferase
LKTLRLQERIARVNLGEREIHVWHLALAGDVFDDFANVLTELDIARGKKFVFERDRNRFLRARYCARSLLGAYLMMSPQDVPIEISEYGKPFLPPSCQMAFNLSHSGDAGVFAIGRVADTEGGVNSAIGIDIEVIRRPSDIRSLATSVFSVVELTEFAALADDALSLPFFTCWTRKEAYLKAIGTGLMSEPRSITVGLQPMRQRLPLAADQFVDVATLQQNNDVVISLAVIGGWESVKTVDYDCIRSYDTLK